MSNKLFHIITLKDSSFLIIAKSWQRPEFYLNELAEELKSFNQVSEVYFDFLVKNGVKDRFYKATFKNTSGKFSQFKSVSVDSETLTKANDFFSCNSQLLQGSLLTPAQKYLLKKELAV